MSTASSSNDPTNQEVISKSREPYDSVMVAPELVELLRRLEAELVSPEIWQSREELEARITPDFVEVGSGGVVNREELIGIIHGADPGSWQAEDFSVRELTQTVALATYRSVIDTGDGGPSLVALRSSIWVLENGAWRMAFHQITRLG